MTHFTSQDLESMPQRYRVNFINSLSGFKSANLVGTVSAQAETNLAIISSVFHIGASPALIGFISRPPSGGRHTLSNILENKHYTLNHVHNGIIDAAHQTSARYERKKSEFRATGLSEYWIPGFRAPFVEESYIRIGIKYREHHTLLNNTVLVIGEILHIEVPEQYLHDDGLIDIEQAHSVALSGLDTYHDTRKLKRLSYAKPDQSLTVIPPKDGLMK